MNKSMITAFFCLSSLFMVNSCHSDSASPSIKILPLGDSLTCASKYKVSYRYPLWKQLIDAGQSVQFVGSQTKKGNGGREWETYKNRVFPAANEGHSGWRSDQILNGLNNGEKGLSTWLKSYDPDIALIHLGTNDLYQKQSPESTRDDIQKIITMLRNKNPRIKVILAEIIPLQTKNKVVRLNQLLVELAKKMHRHDSPVISVDMHSGFDLDADMQKDKIHPNAFGEMKMAIHWFDALMSEQMLGNN